MRHQFTAELEQVRLQVELMAVRVDENLERMREVLRSGDAELARRAIEADDRIDAMHVSLEARCYDLLCREAPVASDLRFLVSVLRLLSELERIGDLSLRVDKEVARHDQLTAEPVVFDVLLSMADEALDRYRLALRALSTMDLSLATELALVSRTMDLYYERLVTELVRLEGPDAASRALASFAVGRSLERIADHATIIGARIRYLLTGDADHLVAEVR